jgi:translation initiation factor 2 alpha subunit (eIF-2alpha)
MSELSEFALPTNPQDIEQIKNSIIEISAQLQMIKDRQDGIKDIKTLLKEEYKMPTSLVNKLVKALDDAAYVEMTTENSTFELVRETIMGDGGLPDDSEVD